MLQKVTVLQFMTFCFRSKLYLTTRVHNIIFFCCPPAYLFICFSLCTLHVDDYMVLLTICSLPGRTAIPDTMASTSMNQSSNLSRRSLSRFNQTIQNYSEIHDDQPSAMSSQVSVDGNESTSNNKLDGAEYEGEVIVNSKGSQFHNNNIQFHFSIYKWPSKGVQYVMSSKRISSKERMTDDRYLSSSEGIGSAYLVMENNKEGVIVNESVSSSKRQMPSTSNDDTVVHETSADVTGSGPVMFDATYQVGEAPPSIGLEDTKQVPILSQKLSDAVAEDSSLKHSSKKTKSNMMSLASLFGEEKKGTYIEFVLLKKKTTFLQYRYIHKYTWLCLYCFSELFLLCRKKESSF